MGMAETLWEPKMNPDQLFECISQAMMNAFDRDGISGWGAVVHIIEKEKVKDIFQFYQLTTNEMFRSLPELSRQGWTKSMVKITYFVLTCHL